MALPKILLQPDGSLTGTFLHGVNLKNPVLVHNLGISCRLWSADFVGVVDPGLRGSHRPIRDIPIAELASARVEQVVAPRFEIFVKAAIFDAGLTLVNGYGAPVHLSENTRSRIELLRDVELAFEAGRRQWAPQAPSRLSCIWLAERGDAGRSVINDMFRDYFIADVRVPFCLSALAADAGWFDDYMNVQKPHYIENYWTGKCHPTRSFPEILIDGIVEFVDPAQLAYVKTHGARF